eukprot:4490861-Pyramimonas_sp.AAC.1
MHMCIADMREASICEDCRRAKHAVQSNGRGSDGDDPVEDRWAIDGLISEAVAQHGRVKSTRLEILRARISRRVGKGHDVDGGDRIDGEGAQWRVMHAKRSEGRAAAPLRRQALLYWRAREPVARAALAGDGERGRA